MQRLTPCVAEQFFLKSPQTRLTRRVREFAREVAPKGVRTPDDLPGVVLNVRRRLEFLVIRELLPRVGNPLARRRALEALQHPTDDFIHVAFEPDAQLALSGVRSAHQIISDGAVASENNCTDINTVLLAVLRCHKVPCRLARVASLKRPGQTSVVELQLGGRHYKLHPMAPERLMSEGLAREHKDNFVKRSRDHWSSGIDLLELNKLLTRYVR